MATLTFRPTGDNGVQQGFARVLNRSAGSHNYECVDEVVADDNDYCYITPSNDVSDFDLYTLGVSVASGTINHVTIYARVKAQTSVTPQCVLYLMFSAADSGFSGSRITTSWVEYSRQKTVNPATGVAWTWTNIAALKAGPCFLDYESVTMTGWVSQVYVVVDYTPPVILSNLFFANR